MQAAWDSFYPPPSPEQLRRLDEEAATGGHRSLEQLVSERDELRTVADEEAKAQRLEYDAAFAVAEPLKRYREEKAAWDAQAKPLLAQHEQLSVRRYVFEEAHQTLKKHVQDADQLMRMSSENYAFRSKWLHGAALCLADLCDRVNDGLPFKEELRSFRNLAKSEEETVQLIAESCEHLAEGGVPTLPQLRTSFTELRHLGSPELSEQAAECVAEPQIQRAIDALEPLEQHLRQGRGDASAAAVVRRWRNEARRFVAAQQMIHFWSAHLTCARFQLVEPWLTPSSEKPGDAKSA